ncbi:hypothetical protein V8E54_010101 [Elaphomyces granulatus]
MRFINIVLLELCAVAGSTFASALPQLFDGQLQVDQNPITGESCLQHDEPHVQQVNFRYCFPNRCVRQPNILHGPCVELTSPGIITAIQSDGACTLFNEPAAPGPGGACNRAENRFLNINVGFTNTIFIATHIQCLH